MNRDKLDLLEKSNITISDSFSKPGKTVFMFPGHGAQYINMLRGLMEHYSVVRETFQRADKIYMSLENRSLSSCIFASKEVEIRDLEEKLSKPCVMQPAIFTCNMALFYLLNSEGIEADCYLGHSLGELAALCAAEVYDFETGFQIAYYRGKNAEMMPIEERGKMLAVGAFHTQELADELLDGMDNCQVSIINSNKYFNISGCKPELEIIKKRCDSKGISSNLLNVTHAFHSKIMKPIVIPYRESISKFTFQKAKKTVFSTILERQYDSADFEQQKMLDILAEQLVTPFDFRNILLKLREEQITNYIEVGPNNMLSKLVKTTLDDVCVLSTNEYKKDDYEAYEFFKAAYVVHKIANKMGVVEKTESEVAKIVSRITMYPIGVIQFSDNSFYEELAITDNKFREIKDVLEKTYEVLKGKITKQTSFNMINFWIEEGKSKNQLSKIPLYPENENTSNDESNYDDLDMSEKIFVEIQSYVAKKYQIDSSMITKDSSLFDICEMVSMESQEKYEVLPEKLLVVENRDENAQTITKHNEEDIKAFVKKCIQEKTGYPMDVLEDDLELEADLGIDSVKQAEIFAKIVENYAYNQAENEDIKGYNTIQKIATYIMEKTTIPVECKKEENKTQEKTSAKGNIVKSEIHDYVFSVIQDKTGYPIEVLEDNLDLEADLGIDSVKQADILGKIHENYGYEIKENENIKELNTIAKIIEYVAKKMVITQSEIAGKTEETLTDRGGYDKNSVKSIIKNIICEKTGYPQEVLEDELELEADLGIDSVKRADIFGKLGEKYGFTFESIDEAKKHNTISEIVEFVMENACEIMPTEESKSDIHESQLFDGNVHTLVKEYVGQRRNQRFVTVTIESPFDENVGQKYVFDNKNVLLIADDLNGELTLNIKHELEMLGAKVLCLSERTEDANNMENVYVADYSDDISLQSTLEKIKNEHNEIQCIVNCYSVGKPFTIEQLSATDWEKRVLSNYNVILYSAKAVYECFNNNKKDTAYFAISNIGGCLGYEELESGMNPLGAITAGFLKGLERELRPFNCKMIDFTVMSDMKLLSQVVIKEIQLIESAVEICYDGSNIRKRPYVIEKTIDDIENKQSLEINSDDVIFFTGGSRGIVHEFIDAIAGTYNPIIIFTGRTDQAKGDEDWIKMTEDEFAAYQSQFMLEEKKRDPQASIVEINARYSKLKNARELKQTLDIFKCKGYKVSYISCDVADINSVLEAIRTTIQKFGKITGIINGAGLPALGKVSNKSPVHSREVVRVKANSFYALSTATKDQPLKFFLSIGSISGRFGMDGQVDYSAAADLIVRLSCIKRQENSSCKYSVLGWSAWEDVGMATHEAVKKVQQEERGLEYISVSEGRQWFMEELLYGAEVPEILFFGKLGTNYPLGQLDYYDCENKKKRSNITRNNYVLDKMKYPLIDQVTMCTDKEISAVRMVNLYKDKHLKDHKVEKDSVFAGVMHMETCCELIELFLDENEIEGLAIQDINNFQFKKFIKVYEGQNVVLKLSARVIEKTEDVMKFNVSIKSDFITRNGILLIENQEHSCGTIIVSNKKKSNECSFAYPMKVQTLVEQSQKFDLQEFYRKAVDNIEFGPTFRYIDVAGSISETEYVGMVSVPDDGQYFAEMAQNETIISPVTLDNIGRFMLFHEFYQKGFSVVPIEMSEIKIYRRFYKGEQLFVYCRYMEETQDMVTFTCQTVDNENRLVLDMGKVVLVRINKYDNATS